ncbi:hypothetical protein G8A07_00590 [Roseateles sp. DAIF2]|uniref:hypothetical protein n=1 Tax=Roseateles sp. DAIF2 TaxID=2714952 RepID=UPI0018A2F7E8|nr:hypothetical protein [Roseateles sp. DAIF2]QPF71564.1 hypothetical protein G8A07_00590 [Roseateles sp. DAIF2]
MQKQQGQQTPVQQQVAGPVEIDAKLLQFVSGGAPKNTWSEPQAELLSLASVQAPKNTW